ncbi:hypothetical protein FOA43_001008 [Brettanomyces nanus]|uniref:Uncharacterized protein n=1 Tax=Eeniella nana TaxID=13502 RepID=A0A875S058_EENNA|nr:uncharacterized protein FOA43_001008 [Brettanomyces nanus]QPG73695.1 hypothetical protein FOA43_001008 [Brettanomyces nanus]
MVALWGIVKRLKEPQVKDNSSTQSCGQSTPSKPSEKALHTPINARQLADLYEKVKRENSVLYSSLKKDSSDQMRSIQPESNHSIADGSVSQSGASQYNNSFFRGFANDSKNIDSSTPRSKSVMVRSSNQAHQSRNASFGINPIERAQLVHLKKRMEADRYRRTRLGYLRRHTQNLVHSRSVTSSRNSSYMDTGINTVEANHSAPLKTTIRAKKVARKSLDSIPEDKRNKSGYFMLKMAYNIDDDDVDKETHVISQAKPLSEKLKFNSNTSLSTLDTVRKPKSFVPKEKPVKSPEKSTRELLNGTSTTEQDEETIGPSPAFKFGALPRITNVVSAPLPKAEKIHQDSVPAFSFGHEKPRGQSAGKAELMPSFSFGSNSVPKVLDKTEVKPISGKPLVPVPSAPFVADGSAVSTFSFGAPAKTETKIGAKSSTVTPAFSFGSKPEKSSHTPSFSFGSKAGSSTPFANSVSPAAPAFASASVPAATLSFGSRTKPESKSAPPAFKLALPTPLKESDKQNSSTPSFQLSAPTQKKPAFQFSSAPPAAKVQANTPGFIFGQKASGMGSSLSAAAPNFGNHLPSQNVQASIPTKPAFSFTSKDSTSTPASSISASSATVASKPTLSFGSTSVPTKPSFSFESSKKNQHQSIDGDSEQPGGSRKRNRNQTSAPPVFKMNAANVVSTANGNQSSFSFGGYAAKPSKFGAVNKNAAGTSFGSNSPTGVSFGAERAVNGSSLTRASTPGAPATTFNSSAFGSTSRASSMPPAFGANTNSNANSSNGFSFNTTNNGGNVSAPKLFGSSSSNNNASNEFNGFNQPSQNSKPPLAGNNASGFGGFGNGNASNGANDGSKGKLFSLNEFPTLPPSHIQSSAFSFDGKNNNNPNAFGIANGNGNGNGNSNGNVNGNGSSFAGPSTFNFNKSATPDINFSGNMAKQDPAAIFSGPPAQPPSHHSRKKLMPRSLRRR